MWAIIIANKRDHDTSIPVLIFDSFEINRVGEWRVPRRVLILGLQENDWATICDLSFGNDRSNA
jgi:hypothetical protein